MGAQTRRGELIPRRRVDGSLDAFLRLVRRLLSSGGGEIQPREVDPAWLDPLLDLGLGGLLVTRAPGWVSALPAELATVIRMEHTVIALRNRLLVEASDRARHHLGRAGVHAVPLKGVALLADGVYADPGVRPTSDLDLLVSPSDARAAIDALREAGYVSWEPNPERALGWLDAATFTDPATPPELELSLDLHWRIGRGGLRFGEGGLEGALLGDSAAAPPVEAHLVHIVEHLLRHLRVDLHLQGVTDLVRLAPHVEDWDRVVGLAGTGVLAPGVAALLETVRSELDAEIPRDVPPRIRPDADPARLGLTLDDLVAAAPSAPVEAPGHRASLGPDPALRIGARGRRRLSGLYRRWLWTGGGLQGARELTSVALPTGSWLAARYPGTPAPLRHLRLWAHGVLWTLGLATSPLSPNQRWESPAERRDGG